MTSFRQIEANRRNAIRSTGPNTEEGKRRSRRNAIRHGLCAETVIENIEDIEDYRAFEAAVIADYDAQTAVERELVLRLASLLWRLRRATAIETDLLRIQAEILRDRRDRTRAGGQPERPHAMPLRVIGGGMPLRDDSPEDRNDDSDLRTAEHHGVHVTGLTISAVQARRASERSTGSSQLRFLWRDWLVAGLDAAQ